MSLTVYLKRFKIIKSKAERIVTLEFRGEKKTSASILDPEELITVNQTFTWYFSTPVDKGELLTITLLEKPRFIAPRVVGKYRLGLHMVVVDGMIPITDSLVDDDNHGVPAYIEMDVYYKRPSGRVIELDDGTRCIVDLPRRARRVTPAVHHRPVPRESLPGPSQPTIEKVSTPVTDIDDDTGLDDLQRNIANLERTLQCTDTVIDMEAPVDDDSSRSRKIKAAGKRFLRRGLAVGADKLSIREVNSKRASTLRSVKSFIRLGKDRRDSSDDEQSLMDLPGSSTEPDAIYSQTSMSSEDLLVDLPSPVETPRTKKMLVALDMAGPSALKAADFQICITVIEARQLAGLNMDPVVCVQVGEQRKYTSVKESTNCPYYNENSGLGVHFKQTTQNRSVSQVDTKWLTIEEKCNFNGQRQNTILNVQHLFVHEFYFVFDFHMPPVMLFDKIITLSVLHSRNFLRANKLLGNFKLDVATVWNQTDRQFYHKWALLTDPDDITAGPKGYLKCDISVIGKGDQVKVPPKSEKDEDDIEANLLLPDGVPVERQRARFIIKIHKADGLPKMDSSLLANIKSAFTGESQDMIDPYVQVCFAGMTGKTSVQKNTCSPVWNEQIVFTEMFPPLCQRIKIQLKDNVPIHPSIIATHFIDLNTISHDGERGFLPTFGPAYVYMYGSTRDCALLDQSSNLNKGIGEGVAYRARLLISIHTEILDNIETPSSEVELEPIMPINEFIYEKHEEFFLFGSIFDVNMIDKSLTDKPIHFELSIGNAGNSLDGPHAPMRRPQDLAVESLDDLNADTGYWQSTTQETKAQTADRYYYFLPYWDTKQCMHVRSIWPDHRRRLYNSNMLNYIIDILEEGITDAETMLRTNGSLENTALASLKSVMETVIIHCAKYVEYMNNSPPLGNTKLDRERQKVCIYEIEQLSTLARTLKAIITKHSVKDRLRTTIAYLNRLRYICEDAQHAIPDIFIWMISNGKRVAYQRIPARDLIYSDRPDETGRLCGKMQTLFLKWPGKKSSTPRGWTVPAKIEVYLWLGLLQDKKHFLDGLPQGYSLSTEIKNVERPRANPPSTIFYSEKHKFQMRAYIYQARSLIGSDSSGLSDPFARVVIGDCSATTEVIDETLSPTWDELLVFDDVLLYSTIDQIKKDPPTIAIEIFDQDKVGKSEFIGRALARPHIKSLYEKYEKPDFPPRLEWFNIIRGGENAGELLATFELLEVPLKQGTPDLPDLPEARDPNGKPLIDVNKGPILPVPVGIRPTLSKYRIEVLFWGLRNLKRVHLLSVDKPRVDIECAGHIIYSSIIQNAKRNPNFTNPVKYIDVELPDQDLYRPPLTIRVLDCRSFGRVTLVGTHTINSIHNYMYTPTSRREREIEDRKKSLIQLQNVDLHNNRIIQDDIIMTTDDRESCPLIIPDSLLLAAHGSGATSPMRRKGPGYAKRELNRKRKPSSESTLDDDDCSKDWWTKYFASVEKMIEEEKEAKKERQGMLQPCQLSFIDETQSPRDSPRSERTKRHRTLSPKAKLGPTITNNSEIPNSSLTKVYPHELEAVPEYEEFKDWLQSFELYRGKKTGDDTEDESRIVGTFKGALKVYKWPLSKDIDDHHLVGFDPNNGFFQGVPSNEPIHVLIRVYIVKATDLHPMDFNGKADPYIVLHLGSRKFSDKEHYQSKQLNPVFGRCFETEATFPHDSMLTIQILDWDLLGKDDLIGETKIDLENRFYSRHRATCGLPTKYEEEGYNRWRDAMKPTQILAKLCKDIKIDPPAYEYGRVRVGRTIFNMSMDDPELFNNPDTVQEQMALNVLRRWHEVPRFGSHLVVEHVETRPLYNPNKPGVEQGRLEMWVDMFPMDKPLPGQSVNISPRKPKAYEMRVIIWNTDDVVLEDDEFFTGEKMSDIYVKGWLKGPDDCQSTDIHYRSLTGEGNFNWRFIYPFEYMEAEERIVISRKESLFSWDETECKIPARLELQVWDADHFSADDFLGALTLDLNRFPRGAKSSKLCTLDMLRNDGTVPMVNIFKQKRIKGWWPFYTKRDNEEMELTGKVEAEIHLLTREEAEKVPAGLGRNEPDPLEKPNRPDASFMWFLNPLKSLRYILWHNYKWTIIKAAFVIGVAILILLLIYAVPGYTVKKFLGA